MVLISIIIGFKNRELNRVKNSLDSLANQHFKNFELIFVDYGSDKNIALSIKSLVNSYPFTTYYYCDSEGWFWNRSHALNIGLKKANGRIILFSDIDLILHANFLSNLSNIDFINFYYTFSCFYLPHNFDLRSLVNEPTQFPESYVGLCAVAKEHLTKINGFDEYYMVWGVEDDDLYYRLGQLDLGRIQHNTKEFKVYHQWHTEYYDKLPAAWYNHMMYYYTTHSRKWDPLESTCRHASLSIL